MALADTVATCKLNLCDRFAIDAAKAAMSRENPAAPGGGGEPTPGEIKCFWLLKLLLNILHGFFFFWSISRKFSFVISFFQYILWLKRSSSSSAIIQFLLFFVESLDDCGLRFLLAMKHFTYLQRCLPLSQRAQLQRQGLASSNIIW